MESSFSSHMSLQSNIKDGFGTAVLAATTKLTLLLYFFKSKGGISANITRAAHSFIEFIHCLSIERNPFLLPFQSLRLHSNATERPGEQSKGPTDSSKAKGLMVTMATTSKNSIFCSRLLLGPWTEWL